jgi:oligopeptide transport system substrate-binding protein
MFAKSRMFSLRLCVCFLSLLLVVSLAAPTGVQEASAQGTASLQPLPGPYEPRFHVQMIENNIMGYDWPTDNPVTVSIDDPSNGPGIDFTSTQPVSPYPDDPNFGEVAFLDLALIDLAPTMSITMTNGTITKTHTVTDLVVTSVDLDANTVSGTGTPGAGLNIQYCSDGGCLWRRLATVQSDGTWAVNFSVTGTDPDEQLTLDIVPGILGEALEPDEDGDHTDYQWGLHHPRIEVRANDNRVDGFDWPPGANIQIKVDDPSTGLDPDYSDSATADNVDRDPHSAWFSLSVEGYDIKVGDVVKATYENVTKQHTVLGLAITDANPDTDMVDGIGTPNQPISVWACRDNSCVKRDESTNGAGSWSTNFAAPGNEVWEQDTLDLQFGTWVDASMTDEDGDHTQYGMTIDWIAPASIPVVFAISSPVDIRVPGATLENISVLNTLNDSLFRLDNDGTLLPLAATGYTVSPNGLVYTVSLRPGAQWSDGQPVTTQHFVDGILRVLDPAVGSDYGFLLYPILNAQAFHDGSLTDRALVGVKALDSQTLELTLEQPAVHFPKILASPVMLPARQDLIDQYGDDWTSPAHFVSNGLYELLEYDAGHLLVEKNLQYNGPVAAAFSQIGFDVVPDPTDQVTAYKNGTVDVLLSTSLSTIMADSTLKLDMAVMPSPGVHYLEFATQSAPLDNPLVRKALAAAIDRQILIDDILSTPWRVEATGVIPPELDGYQGSAVGYSYDPAQAQAFLAQAGYPGGSGFPVLKFLAISPAQTAVLEELKSQWNAVLGITVTIETITFEERATIYSSCRANPSTCPYHGSLLGWVIDYPDAYNIINDLFSPDSSYNHTQWDHPTYRQLIDLAFSEPDPHQRVSYLQQAETILVEQDAAVLPLYHHDGVLVVRPGIYPHYSTTYFSNLAYWSDVDPGGDGVTADVIGSGGGTVAAENNTVSVEVPAGALQQEVTLSVTDLGGNYQITASQDPLDVVSSYSIQPHGLQFDQPVTLTFAWNDSNNDGTVDETDQSEADIFLVKDGEPITPACGANSNCDMAANRLSVQVLSLSHFELVIPAPPGDIVPPLVSSIHLASPNPTSAASVSFIVTFSEPVTGVDLSDFMLTTTGVTGATIMNVSGTGAEYSVTVTTGSGNGKIRLDVMDNNSILDGASNPLGGAALGDGPFTNGQIYLVTKTPTFTDAQFNYWAWSFIERLYGAGITGGCNTSPLNYCPEGVVTRAQMAVFLLRGIHTFSYTPPAIGAGSGFGDVPLAYWSGAWIKQLAAEGITTGCGNGNYCPENGVTRAQMAVFLLRSKYGASYTPPAVGAGTGFGDVPSNYWAAAFIKQLVTEGITSGCGNGNYCPEQPVTRAQMAVFLVRTFGLP